MSLSRVVEVLESYRGREKCMRTIQYGLLLLSPAALRYGKSFQVISSQLGVARVVLRLFDDPSMLHYSLSCLGTKEEDLTTRLLQFLNNVADQLYYPVEHLAWVRDVGALKGSSARLWHLSLLLWAVSLCLTILRSLRKIYLLKAQKKTSQDSQQQQQVRGEVLTVVMQTADLLNAVNWLPNRPWHRPFPQWQVGFLGLISSLIGFKKMMS